MLYSHNQEDEKVRLFAIFLDNAAKGDDKYAATVNDVILETQQYVAGKKNIYNINRDLINVILLLSGLDNQYFAHLADNPEKYNNETYSHVLNIISQQNQVPIY